MKRFKELLALILVSIFLGMILSIHFKTVNKTVGEGVLPTQRAQQLASELKKVQSDKDSLLNRVAELESKIEQYEKSEVDKNVLAENLYKDAMKYRMLAGYVDLEGEGIILEINDPPVDLQFGYGFSIVDELDLVLEIISILNAADAEAISVNDQRYTSFTEIVRAGNHIEINGVSNSSPIVIKAIGNPSTLESALSIKHGKIWELRSLDYIVHIRQDKNISVPRYRKVKDFIYATPVDEVINWLRVIKMINKNKFTLAIFSIIIGAFIATQIKANVEDYVPVTIKSIENTKNEIDSLKREIEELSKVVEVKEEEMLVLENIARGDENIIDVLKGDLYNNMITSGYAKLEGPGISIKMYDNPDSEIVGFDINDDIIHDIDVLNILNDLRVAGAEAISINGQRVMSTSEIKCNGPIIRINDKSIGTPFIISVIGDPQLLMASVNAPDTYGDILKNVYFIGFEPKIEDKVTIPAYKGDFTFNYAKPKGEGDI